jgi:hypothetical protein
MAKTSKKVQNERIPDEFCSSNLVGSTKLFSVKGYSKKNSSFLLAVRYPGLIQNTLFHFLQKRAVFQKKPEIIRITDDIVMLMQAVNK